MMPNILFGLACTSSSCVRNAEQIFYFRSMDQVILASIQNNPVGADTSLLGRKLEQVEK
jgi:hypothetical protein